MEASHRWLALLKGEKTDRIPNVPMCAGHCAKIMGMPNLGDYYSKPKFSYKAQVVTRELYNYDQPPFMMDPGYGCEVWGGKTILPYNPKMGAPIPAEPACKTVDDLDKLEVPDPRTGAWMPEFREMVKLCVDNKQMPMVVIFGGWITSTAPMIVSIEDFMMWLIEEPDLAKKALKLSTEFGLNLAESFVEDFGTDTWIPWDPNPTDSNVLIDVNMFKEFPLPNVKKLHKGMLDMGLPLIWTHWCSDHNQTMEAGLIEEIPNGENGILSFGPEVPMDVQAKRFGDNYNLMGNINPPLIMTAEYDEWQDLCLKNIEEGKDMKKVYSLCVGCELPPPSPPSNVFGMTQACEKYGKY